MAQIRAQILIHVKAAPWPRSGAGRTAPGTARWTAPWAKAEPARHRAMHHQHFADRGRSDEADQPLCSIDDADRRRRFFLQQAKRLVETMTVPKRRHLAGHHVAHSGIRAALLERADDIVARQQPERPAEPVDYREFALARAQ